MLVYRFRIAFEDYEDIFREIEIRTIQTFEDLHLSFLSSIQFDGKHQASFYMSDDNWKKGKEIAYATKKNKDGSNIVLMKDARLCDYIADPHQRIYYTYDPEKQWSFYVELAKISQADESQSYPRCLKIAGEAPKQYVSNVPPPTPEDYEFSDEETENETVVAESDDDTDDENSSEGMLGEDDEAALEEMDTEGESSGEEEV